MSASRRRAEIGASLLIVVGMMAALFWIARSLDHHPRSISDADPMPTAVHHDRRG